MCVCVSQKCSEDEEVGTTIVGARRLYICYQCDASEERVVLFPKRRRKKREWQWHQQRNCCWYKQAH